jgi:molybdopterin-guanine dinucleotide biosynthesis protein A
MSEPLSAIVLAGGQSRRFGRDKASEMVAGRTLLDWVVHRLEPVVDEFLLVTLPGRSLPRVNAEKPVWLVYDEHPGQGPLAGIQAGLREARNDLALAVACDMPLLDAGLVRFLVGLAAGYDLVVPVAGGYPQVTHALYRRSLLPAIEELLRTGDLRLAALFEHALRLEVPEAELRAIDPYLRSFSNLNSQEDLERIREQLDAQSAPFPER